MKINELIRKIREENGLSIRALSEKIDVTHSFISKVEAGDRKVSQKLLESLVKKFPVYEKQLSKAYIDQNLPEEMKGKITIDGFKQASGEASNFKIKVYEFEAGKSGEIDTKKYIEVDYLLLNDMGNNIKKNGYVFNIKGDEMEPYFFNNDTIVFLKEKFEDWQSLDSNLILVKINDNLFIRKLFFEEGEPFLFSFKNRLYPKIKIDDSVEYIGQLDSQLERKVKGMELPKELKTDD